MITIFQLRNSGLCALMTKWLKLHRRSEFFFLKKKVPHVYIFMSGWQNGNRCTKFASFISFAGSPHETHTDSASALLCSILGRLKVNHQMSVLLCKMQ